MMAIENEEVIKLLQKASLKATPQRISICKFVLSNKSHPSTEKIYNEVKKIHPTISQATVYKTLRSLTDKNILKELSFSNTHSRYDTNNNIHINLICNICGSIEDYESDTVNLFWENINKELDNEITDQRFDIYRICNSCKI